MTLIGDELADEIIRQVWQRYLLFAEALGAVDIVADGPQPYAPSSLQRDLQLLLEIAAGKYLRTDDLMQRVEAALTRLLDVLLGNVLQHQVTLPPDFWETAIGILVMRVRWWLSADDLITISNAAALAFGENTQANRMRVVRALENGVLMWIPDPSVANPQQNKRVLRSQVEYWRNQRQSSS